MRKLQVFQQVSLDGFFTDLHGDMTWAHKHDAEWGAFASDNASGGGELVFGRKTYEQMAGFWPTEAAMKQMPTVAKQMNALPKVVFSRTLKKEGLWTNTRLFADAVEGMRTLKAESGRDMVIMGSGEIVAPLAAAGLIDGYQLAVNPIVLGQGRSMFAGLEKRLNLKLEKTRSFENGNVVLWYTRQ